MEGKIIFKRGIREHKQSEKKEIHRIQRYIYNTKREVIECKQSCKAITKIQRKRKVQEREIYRAEI